MYELTIDEVKATIGDLMILIKQHEKHIADLERKLMETLPGSAPE